ncbi:MAG TPA: PAS domain-containing protein, partial [Gemmatimonadales bacterium]|nr:PAS domain-containing protein [Gemmatimonadales bacterium]
MIGLDPSELCTGAAHGTSKKRQTNEGFMESGDLTATDASAAGLDAQLQQLLEALPVGAYACDLDGLITCFNAAAVKLWGRAPRLMDSADRWCGSFRLFRAGDGVPIPHEQCWMALAIRTGKSQNGEEIIIERPDGERVVVLAHASPIRDADGRLLGAVNVLVDISDRK